MYLNVLLLKRKNHLISTRTKLAKCTFLANHPLVVDRVFDRRALPPRVLRRVKSFGEEYVLDLFFFFFCVVFFALSKLFQYFAVWERYIVLCIKVAEL